MGQMKRMKAVIDDLHSCSEQLSDIAAEREAMFSTAPEEAVQEAEEVTVPAETPKPELKLEDVRAVLADISRAGHTAEVRALIEKYGADRLSKVDPKNYEALLRDAEVLHEG